MHPLGVQNGGGRSNRDQFCPALRYRPVCRVFWRSARQCLRRERAHGRIGLEDGGGGSSCGPDHRCANPVFRSVAAVVNSSAMSYNVEASLDFSGSSSFISSTATWFSSGLSASTSNALAFQETSGRLITPLAMQLIPPFRYLEQDLVGMALVGTAMGHRDYRMLATLA